MRSRKNRRGFLDLSSLWLSHTRRGRDLSQDTGFPWDFSRLRPRTGSWAFQAPQQQRKTLTSMFPLQASEECLALLLLDFRLDSCSRLLFQLPPMLSILKLSKKQQSLIWKVLACLPGN